MDYRGGVRAVPARPTALQAGPGPSGRTERRRRPGPSCQTQCRLYPTRGLTIYGQCMAEFRGYPVLKSPYPAGVLTGQDYQEKHQIPASTMKEWRRRPTFPRPVGWIPSPGHNGRYRLAYQESQIDAFRPSVWGGNSAGLPILKEPLAPGLITASDYEIKHDLLRATVWRWRRLPGFPALAGVLACQNGGNPRPVVNEAALDAFCSANRLPRPGAWWDRRILAGWDLDARVTLTYFARNVAGAGYRSVTKYADDPGFPRGVNGRYRLGDLADYFDRCFSSATAEREAFKGGGSGGPGKLLAAARQRMGLRQEDLAVRLGYTRTTLAGVETGLTPGSDDFWQAVAQHVTGGEEIARARRDVIKSQYPSICQRAGCEQPLRAYVARRGGKRPKYCCGACARAGERAAKRLEER